MNADDKRWTTLSCSRCGCSTRWWGREGEGEVLARAYDLYHCNDGAKGRKTPAETK